MYKIYFIIVIFLSIGCDNYLLNPLSLNTDINNLSHKNSSIHNKSLQISIKGETDFYITDYILPDHSPYVMEIDVIAKTNSKEKINWYTDKEYVIHECPDDWECPYIFDLMSDSTTYSNNRGISRNTILVSPEFVNDTITIYSYFIDNDKKRYRDSISLVLEW